MFFLTFCKILTSSTKVIDSDKTWEIFTFWLILWNKRNFVRILEWKGLLWIRNIFLTSRKFQNTGAWIMYKGNWATIFSSNSLVHDLALALVTFFSNYIEVFIRIIFFKKMHPFLLIRICEELNSAWIWLITILIQSPFSVLQLLVFICVGNDLIFE